MDGGNIMSSKSAKKELSHTQRSHLSMPLIVQLSSQSGSQKDHIHAMMPRMSSVAVSLVVSLRQKWLLASISVLCLIMVTATIFPRLVSDSSRQTIMIAQGILCRQFNRPCYIRKFSATSMVKTTKEFRESPRFEL